MKTLVNKVNKWFGGKQPSAGTGGDEKLVVVPRAEHGISRDDFSESALKVLYRLHNAGYQAYIVGGAVRDVMLGYHPKDFDVATDAKPEEIRKLFRNCRLIGRRFRLAHILFGREVIEVATFRAADSAKSKSEHGVILRDNTYGTVEEDAWRRDFSVNALYYNIADFSVYDYCGGIKDLKARQMRMIGDPEERYREDPVRMLRAIRLATKLELDIHPKTLKPIAPMAHLLEQVSSSRLWEECRKLFLTGHSSNTMALLREEGIAKILFPETDRCLNEVAGFDGFVERAFINTDKRIAADQPVTPAFLFAVLLWEPLLAKTQHHQNNGLSYFDAYYKSMSEVLSKQSETIAITKRVALMIRDIWSLQPKLEQPRGKRAWQAYNHPKFRAGYDFLLLRSPGDEALKKMADWWTAFQEKSDSEQREMVKALNQQSAHRPQGKSAGTRKKRRRRRPARAKSNTGKVDSNPSEG